MEKLVHKYEPDTFPNSSFNSKLRYMEWVKDFLIYFRYRSLGDLIDANAIMYHTSGLLCIQQEPTKDQGFYSNVMNVAKLKD